MVYRYSVEAREGAPGYADDDVFVSREYDTFEKAYKGLSSFCPESFWDYLRSVGSRYIQKDDNPKVKFHYKHIPSHLKGGKFVIIEKFFVDPMDLEYLLDITEEDLKNLVLKRRAKYGRM